jgi:hypothetical protein
MTETAKPGNASLRRGREGVDEAWGHRMKERSRDLSRLCSKRRRNCRRALPQNEIGSAILVKGRKHGHPPRNPARVLDRGCRPQKGEI